MAILLTSCPTELRQMIRKEEWTEPTLSLAPGYVQANLVTLPEELAFDFLLFCQRNPQACPVLEVVESGHTEPALMAPGADLRTDIPRYRVFGVGGIYWEVTDATEYWRDNLVSFLLGCNFSFQSAITDAGIRLRHFEAGKSDPTFVTGIETSPAGVFHGPMVVSMWPIQSKDLSRVIQITTRFPSAHGAPVHIGDPQEIGIRDILNPEYGDVVDLEDGEVPVFWACGVTPQEAILRVGPSVAITHSAGHMFITDRRHGEISIL